MPPLLHFSERLDDFMTPDTTFLSSLRVDESTISPTRAMHHVQFTTDGFLVARVPAVATATQASEGTAADVTMVAERTARFLVRWQQVPAS